MHYRWKLKIWDCLHRFLFLRAKKFPWKVSQAWFNSMQFSHSLFKERKKKKKAKSADDTWRHTLPKRRRVRSQRLARTRVCTETLLSCTAAKKPSSDLSFHPSDGRILIRSRPWPTHWHVTITNNTRERRSASLRSCLSRVSLQHLSIPPPPL